MLKISLKKMAKVRNSKKNNGILKFKLVMERLQKGFFLVRKRSHSIHGQETVPSDVKEGHFAVIASDDYVERRFVVPIECLHHPSFQRLLERAAEEYGFDHEGALMVPCRPSELEWMLEEQIGSHDWTSYKTTVESC
ncbi:putative small auxin-up RNA [Helianthus annuus]|nr:putative small auxin-up RNA [Helianthus annuus]KAJ0686853.1 putative small auxin-up RNA [Helianthus annuus]KAJ0690659.1 putative small auxin-up RNA [Helianthus annuus]KAJ0872277.1 putative small auxin-up RNA [Helianthus annuus]